MKVNSVHREIVNANANVEIMIALMDAYSNSESYFKKKQLKGQLISWYMRCCGKSLKEAVHEMSDFVKVLDDENTIP